MYELNSPEDYEAHINSDNLYNNARHEQRSIEREQQENCQNQNQDSSHRVEDTTHKTTMVEYREP